MVRLCQNSFFGGQLDFEMMGRQDYQRYMKGATKLKNFNIVKRGGLDKRRGFDRIVKLTDQGFASGQKIRAIPYAWKKTHGFVLLMSQSKCLVVSTSTLNVFTSYTIEGLANGLYTESQIQELDYQQCGDVIYIASQYHKPAYIEHVIDDNGNHGFHYYTLDLDKKGKGIPSITASRVTRLPVTDEDHNASLFTEKYKVSAVYPDGETLPCAEYSSANASPWGASSWNGTNYPMPWTESQKIRLTIKPVGRTNDDGTIELPDEVRIYKKSFNYYGLIGTAKVSGISGGSATAITSSAISALSNVNANGTIDVLDSTSTVDYGKDCKGKSFTSGTKYAISSIGSSTGGTIVLTLGVCYYVEGTSSVTFYYKANKATKVYFYKTSSSYITKTLVAGTDESYTTSNATGWQTEYNNWCASKNAAYSVSIAHSALSGSSFGLKFTGGTGILANIRNVISSAIDTITFDDNYITPDTSVTPLEQDSDAMFSGEREYPGSVALSQQRLIWASSIKDPARVWLSEVGEFYNYTTHELQTVSDAIDFKLPITRFAKINHICEMRKLLMFNSACEWLVDSASSVQGITYETIQAYPQSYSGSNERLKPIICNNSLIFCERTGQAVRRFAYDISNDGFAGRDVSILSSSIFENNNIVDWTYQQFPYSTLWCVLNNGTLASFEYMEEQDIMAWMTHSLGGGGVVKSIATSYAVSPALDKVNDVNYYPYATHEEVFAVVERNGQVWLERMRVASKPSIENADSTVDSLYHTLCLDGMRVITNAGNLTNESGAVFIPADTTTGATITRSEAVSKCNAGVTVYEGFPYDAEYTSVYPSISQNFIGAGQFDIKHVQGVGLRLRYSHGGKLKAHDMATTYDDIVYKYDADHDDRASFSEGNVTLHNHDTHMIPLKGVNARDGRIDVKVDTPYPFTMLSYEIDFEVEETPK